VSGENWIENAMVHFNEYGGKPYMKDDELSQKSQNINSRFQKLLNETIKDVNNSEAKRIILNKRGSKWSIQGQQRLKYGIWYRAYLEEFGDKYPIVLGAYIGKNGITVSIQLYNPSLGNLKISKKLGEIIAGKVKEKYTNLDAIKRGNPLEQYNDFGFSSITSIEDFKTNFAEVRKCYEQIVPEINKELMEKLKNFNTDDNTKLLEEQNLPYDKRQLSKVRNEQTNMIHTIIRIDDKFKIKPKLSCLIDTITQKDVDDADETQQELFKQALEFNHLLGGKSIDNDAFIKLLKEGQNIIYYGAPGTGKTFGVLEDVKKTVDNEPSRFALTQFHPSYSYEDFVEGFRPIGVDETTETMKFALQDGEFTRFCKEAAKQEEAFNELKEHDFKSAVESYGYFFIVDEINRAELSRVFGELLFALEYRGAESGMIKTQYASMRSADEESFFIPSNLFFIGTMNDVDRSIESFDLALRRRFIWIRKDCKYDVIKNNIKQDNKEAYVEACENLNSFVTTSNNQGLNLGQKYEIGHAYFLKIDKYATNESISKQAMNKLFSYHIEPLLSEYLRSEFDEEQIRTHLDEIKKQFTIEKNNDNNS
jgi:5-methylcytosine-specific restriction protein B